VSSSPNDARRQLVITLVLLVGVVVLRSTVFPPNLHFAFHCGVVIALALLARSFGLTADELGLARATWRSGALAALGVFIVVGAVVAIVVWLGRDATSLDDGRVQVDAGSMVWKALVVIPIGTVLMEELAFRGIILALGRRATSTRNAVLVSSAAFGVWHVITAWNTASGASSSRVLAVAGTVVATAVLGVVLCGLRLRFRSLLPPIAAHTALNSVAFAVAWLAAR
jgi:membrane protease YdiL (CAAX protease family)